MEMKSGQPLGVHHKASGGSEQRLGFERLLWPLVDRILHIVPDSEIAEATLRKIRERAPDEQLALAFLTKLLEHSPLETLEMLRDPQWTSDLVFCLGASELIGTSLLTLSTNWTSAFDEARTSSVAGMLGGIRFNVPVSEDSAQMTQRLAEFKRR